MYKGKWYTWRELSKISGIPKTTLQHRVRIEGGSLESAMKKPKKKKIKRRNRKKEEKQNNELFNKSLSDGW